ncbi:hypothetical protein MRGA327_21480 [Mycobacterium tuberculosis RGTB327]|nr:hypothetical protein MRGA327_21480 [Mycobacterium tuberculosis RGTB327]
MVGLVFLSEGIQKFMYPDQLGPGRFERIGIPAATFFADLDGVVEIVCGTLVLLGLLTRVAAVPLLIDMVGAIVLTKLRALQPGGFLGVEGFWGMAHAARTDLSMLLGLIFLLWSGPGRWSLDRRPVQTRHGLRREVNPRRSATDAPDSTTSQRWRRE